MRCVFNEAPLPQSTKAFIIGFLVEQAGLSPRRRCSNTTFGECAFTKPVEEQNKIFMIDFFVSQIRHKKQNFLGFCVDIGAPTSVVGLQEIRRIYAKPPKKSLRPSTKWFQFSDAIYQSLETSTIPLGTPVGTPNVYVKLDVISADILALLGLKALDLHSPTADTVSNRLVKKLV